MALRFHLYNERLGPLTIDKADPIGINDITQIVKKSEEWEGTVFEIILNVEFIKQARKYLKVAHEIAGGIDAIVHITLYDRNPNTRQWEHYFTGQVNWNKYDVDEEKIAVNVEQTGIERRILNLMDTDVPLESSTSEDGSLLPVMKVLHDVTYHSKTVVKQTDIGPGSAEEYPIGSVNLELPGGANTRSSSVVMYVQLDTTNQKFTELADVYQSGASSTDFAQQNWGGVDLFWPNRSASEDEYIDFLLAPTRIVQRNRNFAPIEAGIMQIDIQVRAKAKVVAMNVGVGDVDVDGGQGIMPKLEVIAWYEKRNPANEPILIKELGRWNVGPVINDSRETDYETKSYQVSSETAVIGEKHFVYLTYRLYGTFEPPSIQPGSVEYQLYLQHDPAQTWIRFKSATFFGESVHQTGLMHEVVKRCVQFYTNVDDCFYSPLLGRTDLGYPEDGEASLIGLTSGNKLRANGKPLIVTLNDILEFLNARYCIGFGFKVINGKQMFVVDKRSKFYDKTKKILSLGPVYNVKKSLNPKFFWKKVEYGYVGKLDIGQVNAIDEFNTIRRANPPIVNTKNTLTITTKMRASGNQIEYQRRLTGTTIDSKLDDENFVVSLIRTATGFRTKAMEGYDYVVGVSFPETQYNFDLRPAECLRAWSEWIACSLIKSKSLKVAFRYGEVNYTMKAKKTGQDEIAENEDLNLAGVEPIFGPYDYTFEFRLSRDQMKLIKLDPDGYIEFFDRFGEVFEGFIETDKGIEHDPNKGTASFKLRMVHRGKLGTLQDRLEQFNIRPIDLKTIKKSEYPNRVIQSIKNFFNI